MDSNDGCQACHRSPCGCSSMPSRATPCDRVQCRNDAVVKRPWPARLGGPMVLAELNLCLSCEAELIDGAFPDIVQVTHTPKERMMNQDPSRFTPLPVLIEDVRARTEVVLRRLWKVEAEFVGESGLPKGEPQARVDQGVMGGLYDIQDTLLQIESVTTVLENAAGLLANAPSGQ